MAKLLGGTRIYGAATIDGNVTVNRVYTAQGLFWSGNNNIISTGGGGGAAAGASGQLQFNDGGILGPANLLFDSITGNIVANAGTVSTSTTTGALVVSGGLGVTGNVYTNAIRTTTGIYWSGNGNPISGVTYTVSTTPPTGPTKGDRWYDTTTDIIFEYTDDGTNQVWVDTSSAFTYSNATVTGSTLSVSGPGAIFGNLTLNNWLIPIGANTAQNIGTTTQWWGTFYGTSSQARYADLAENYVADAEYSPGTVVVFGGPAEITVTDQSHDTRVAGVISTDPAYLMNAGNTEGLPVALTGRVPCLVRGPVNKGTVLVTGSQPGVAEALNTDLFKPGCVIGKSLEMITDNSIKTIEIVVGRF
jgi:hypothetical protein